MMAMRKAVPLLGLLVLAPAGASAQNTLPGRLAWNGTNDAFTWVWKKANNTLLQTVGGGAYSAGLELDATGSTYYWPAHGTTGFGPAVDIYCIDFLHVANTNQAGYEVYFTNLAGPLTNTRGNDLNAYLQTAWLADQMETLGTTTLGDKQARAQIHAAMWWILSGQPTGVWNGTGNVNLAGSYTTMGAGNAWVNLAQTGFTSLNTAGWTVATPKCVTNIGHNLDGVDTPDACAQEFLIRNAVPNVTVPEPATMVLLATGLAAVGFLGRRRRRNEG